MSGGKLSGRVAVGEPIGVRRNYIADVAVSVCAGLILAILLAIFTWIFQSAVAKSQNSPHLENVHSQVNAYKNNAPIENYHSQIDTRDVISVWYSLPPNDND